MKIQKWEYHWVHLASGKSGIDVTPECTTEQFLSLIARWNSDDRWKYWPVLGQIGIVDTVSLYI